MSRRAVVHFMLAVLLFGLAVLTVVAGVQMKQLLTQLAVTRVTNTVNSIVTQAVNETIDSGEIKYEDLISFEKDNEGKITAVKTNMEARHRPTLFTSPSPKASALNTWSSLAKPPVMVIAGRGKFSRWSFFAKRTT